jgi:guanine nucleotide-binding protein subunit alpha
MGSCISQVMENIHVTTNAPDRDQQSYRVSRQIERQLKSQQQEFRSVIKVLLLGSGTSGKSTVMKQFKIIHRRGFSVEERKTFRDAIWRSGT